MKVFSQILIHPSPSGLGEYLMGEIRVSPTRSFASAGNLLNTISNSGHAVLPLEYAIINPDFIALGIEDLRSQKIHNQPSNFYAQIQDGEIRYFGIVETEVSEDFYKKIHAYSVKGTLLNDHLISAASELLLFAEKIARSSCLDQKLGDQCICFSCEASRLIAKAKGETSTKLSF